MSNEYNRQASPPSPNSRSTELKASDFFPPGEGWNQAEKPDEGNARKEDGAKPGSPDKH